MNVFFFVPFLYICYAYSELNLSSQSFDFKQTSIVVSDKWVPIWKSCKFFKKFVTNILLLTGMVGGFLSGLLGVGVGGLVGGVPLLHHALHARDTPPPSVPQPAVSILNLLLWLFKLESQSIIWLSSLNSQLNHYRHFWMVKETRKIII